MSSVALEKVRQVFDSVDYVTISFCEALKLLDEYPIGFPVIVKTDEGHWCDDAMEAVVKTQNGLRFKTDREDLYCAGDVMVEIKYVKDIY